MATYSFFVTDGFNLIEKLDFPQLVIKNNLLWKTDNENVYLYNYDDPSMPLPKYLSNKKNVNATNLTFKKFEDVIRTYLKQGMVSGMNLGRTIYDNEESEVLNELKMLLRFKVVEGIEVDKNIAKSLELFDELVFEEGIIPSQIQIRQKDEVGSYDSTLYASGILSVPLYYNHTVKRIENIAVLHENATDIMKTAVSISENIVIKQFEEVELQEHEKVNHPLCQTSQVIELFYSTVGEEVKKESGLSNEEWENIRVGLLNYGNSLKDKQVYQHQVDEILKPKRQ